MRVLLTTFACAPGPGSEPGVGWGIVCEAAKRYQVWALTSPTNRALIEAELELHPLPSVQFVYVALPGWITRLAWKPGRHQIYYAIWLWQAAREGARLHGAVGFDLAHHVTYVNSWIPPFIGRIGIRFVWSAGIREPFPLEFLGDMTWMGRVGELLRNLLLAILGPLSARLSGRRAAWVLSASPPERWEAGVRVAPFALGGMSSAEIDRLGSLPGRSGEALRVLSVGRLLGWKGYALGLHAFSRLLKTMPASEYWVVGEGPEEKYLRDLSRRLGLAGHVKFMPWQPRQAVLRLLSEVDVLLHPSLHEQFGFVILEAMAAGKAVICLDVGGPSLLIQADNGIKVPVTTRGQVIADLAASLERLARQPELRLSLGAGARRSARESWTWDAVGRRLFAFYE